jgi:uroporphyrinogen III methyltransferase/synthase
VLVTRTREQAEGLVDRLHALGAEVVVVPLISTVPVAPPEAVRAMHAQLVAGTGGRWVAFTSATAVRLVRGALDADAFEDVGVAAVGEATARAAREAGLAVDVVPERGEAEALAEALVRRGVSGATVWLPAAEGARETLRDRLGAAGATVLVQALYRSESPPGAAARLRRALASGLHAVTLTSGSTVRHLVAALSGDPLPDGVAVVCIGPRTADEARAAGLRVDAVADVQSVEGLASALSSLLATLP